MGLFSKRPPCPICGGKVTGILPWKIEGQYVCKACYGKIDMDSSKEKQLTMQEFREYLQFYDQNQQLKDKFVISETVDFGVFDTKIIFDYESNLFCMSKRPDKTVFEGKHLKSFTIKEDNALLFEGSAAGIRRFESTVSERARAMAPQIARFIMNKSVARTLDRLDDGKENGSAPRQYFNIPEPFRSFNVELHLDHPYWTVIRCDMGGPRFSNENPDINDYLHTYQNRIGELEKFVAAFRRVSFPNASEQYVGFGASGMQAAQAGPAASTDVIDEIKKYKTLMDEGIINRQEFEAKKKQLLGI